MDPPLKVYFRHNKVIPVSSESFYRWIPVGQVMPYSPVDAEYFVEHVYSYFGFSYSIRKAEVRDALESFFECLRKQTHYMLSETRQHVADHLDTQLTTELASTSRWGTDLIRTRHRFVILSYFASMTSSKLLAQALFKFGLSNLHTILQSDQPDYISSEWQPATKNMRDLVPAEMYHTLIHGFSHKNHHMWDWNRGRAVQRLAPPMFEHRALSAPARRRSRTPNFQLVPFQHAMMARTPPMMSPMRVIEPSPYDEVGALQWQQEEMAAQLENLRRDVDEVKEASWW
ncbi:hypothetical protein P153DRAFT_368248 [Dothidotthia symphoricarpi CBS 119687]|uniref:Uncharacterized protein n=1 Tax=Dothidotthia symphoricarpi CBS 119687 TaxID=1392245 RepID=A0A6A6A6Q0_9PLEO|nr:uncharacterized protein P153DRAFT_368248 [Dothidotthia symphoricarpi CBS 119687]KAF2127672.1 hypothetical protein P153DRAFT_368248 [Dothidotthia symphoricarpi CBS 119687]